MALILDLELKPNMHVYAPGVQGYIPDRLENERERGVCNHDVTYPKPEILFLKAIDEKVPVFQGQVRLTREVTIGPDAKVRAASDAGGQFTVEGTLRYQACDDRVCYIPQELPVRWTLTYEGFDRQRVPEPMQRKAPQ